MLAPIIRHYFLELIRGYHYRTISSQIMRGILFHLPSKVPPCGEAIRLPASLTVIAKASYATKVPGEQSTC